MIKLLHDLERYWDIERIPKHDLTKEEEYFVDIKFANIFYIVMVIFLFTVTALFVGGGML